jgi:hypothetical protein
MKLPKLINVGLLSVMLTAVLMLASACKKDKEQKVSNYLMGGWNEKGLPTNVSRSLHFFGDSVVVNIAASGVVYSATRISGTYKAEGNNLILNLNKQLVTESGKQAIITTYTGKLYENATFKVDGNTLTLNYTTYPADAPVATTAAFSRTLPD